MFICSICKENFRNMHIAHNAQAPLPVPILPFYAQNIEILEVLYIFVDKNIANRLL